MLMRETLSPAQTPDSTAETVGAPKTDRPRRMRRHAVLHWLRVGALYALAVAGIAFATGPVGPSVNSYLAAASAARTGYRYDRALAWYAAASAQAPDNPLPHCLAGDVYMLQREWRPAAGAYAACANAGPNDPNAWLKQGDALNAAGDLNGARTAWQRAVAVGSLSAHRRLGALDERQQRFADALREWALLPANDPQALEHLGLLALWRGDYGTASADFVAARATPNQYAQQAVDEGFVVFAAHPSPGPRGLGQLGFLFLSAGMPYFAIAPLQQAVAGDPSFGDAHAYLGWALWQLGDAPDARPEIAAGLRLAPYLSFAYFASAEVAARDGKISQALALVQRGTELDASNPALWSLDGQLELALYQYPQAEVAFDNAARLSLDPAYTIAALTVYAAHAIGLATGRAHTAAITAMQRFPGDSEVYDLVSQVDSELGYTTIAYYTAVQAQALDPTNPDPYVLLAGYSLNQGDYVAAALDLRTALALWPHGPRAEAAATMLAPLRGSGS